jgi:hypothetical protein
MSAFLEAVVKEEREVYGNGDIGSIESEMMRILPVMWTTFTGIP